MQVPGGREGEALVVGVEVGVGEGEREGEVEGVAPLVREGVGLGLRLGGHTRRLTAHSPLSTNTNPPPTVTVSPTREEAALREILRPLPV